jgi:flagellar protein FlaI
MTEEPEPGGEEALINLIRGLKQKEVVLGAQAKEENTQAGNELKDLMARIGNISNGPSKVDVSPPAPGATTPQVRKEPLPRSPESELAKQNRDSEGRPAKINVHEETPAKAATGPSTTDLRTGAPSGRDKPGPGPMDHSTTPNQEEWGAKTQWSEGNAMAEEKIVLIDDLNDLSGVILPKGATFKIDEIHIHQVRDAFAGAIASDLPPEIDAIWRKGIPDSVIQTISSDVASIGDAGGAKGGVFGRFSLKNVIRHRVEEYNPTLHGPLVNLVFPPRTGIEQIDLYPVNPPFAYIRIIYDHSTHEYTYEVLEPVLTPAEADMFQELKTRIFERLEINTKEVTNEIAQATLRTTTDDIVADFGIVLSPPQRAKIRYNMEKEFLGHGLIDPIMHDKYIEDISCDGVNVSIFIYHSRYESMKTTMVFTRAEELDSYVTKLAQRSGKYISIAEPMLDATMSDGSRIQMTLGQEVTAHGSTFTIRKFKDEPITPTDLIEWATFTPLAVAYLWLAVEGGKSCIFAGGTASGKTTSLNAISLFIPPLAKIVTLEDTRELKLPHPNWIPSITRSSFDKEGKGEIDMYELLRAALRQRPEYIIVGECRGREAQTLFQAMSTGHVTYSTMHADSVASAVHRLENPPLDVPRNMLSALDIVCVQIQARVAGQRIRRNKQIIEILDIDPRTNELITNEVFRWHQATDTISYSGKSYVLESIMEMKGWDEERMREELKRRQEVLEWMRIRKIRNFKDVSHMLISYHRDPEVVIRKVRAEIYE